MSKYIQLTPLLNEVLNDKFNFIGSPEEVFAHDKICDYAIDVIKSQAVYAFDDDEAR